MFEDRIRRWRFKRLNSVCGQRRKVERLLATEEYQPELYFLMGLDDTLRRREARLRDKLS